LYHRGEQQRRGSSRGAGFAASPQQHGGCQHQREEVTQEEGATGLQDARALAKSRLLISPVIERGGAHDEIEAGIAEGQMFCRSEAKTQALVCGMGAGDSKHGMRGVNALHRLRIGKSLGQLTQQVTGAAAHVEDALGR
jgi:hypothetical protein